MAIDRANCMVAAKEVAYRFAELIAIPSYSFVTTAFKLG